LTPQRIVGETATEPAEPEPKSLAELNAIMAASEPTVRGGTRAVLGEGPIGAPLAFVGEQPGDQEDIEGRPFVGPAGQLLDRAFGDAGIDRRGAYLTNAVKHFKFEPRGKRRIHQKPTAGEVRRYRWWLMKEIEFVHPVIVVALGGTRWRFPARRCRSSGAADRRHSRGGRASSPSTRPTSSAFRMRPRSASPMPIS
jgi:DNA polymerase